MSGTEGSLVDRAYNCYNRHPEDMVLHHCTAIYLHGIIYPHPCCHRSSRGVDEQLDVLQARAQVRQQVVQMVSYKMLYSTSVTLVGSVESSRSSWLIIASALKSFTCTEDDKVSQSQETCCVCHEA